MPGRGPARVLGVTRVPAPSPLAGVSFLRGFGTQGGLQGMLGGASVYGAMGIIMSSVSAACPHALMIILTALLLAGWLAAQLEWEPSGTSGNSLGFEKTNGEKKSTVQVTLAEKAGESINQVTVKSATAEFRIGHQPGADLLEVSFGRTGGRHMQQLLPAGKGDPVSLVQEELMRGGPHKVYLRAVEKVRAFL